MRRSTGGTGCHRAVQTSVGISSTFLLTCLDAQKSSQPTLASLWRTWAPAAKRSVPRPPIVLSPSTLALGLSWELAEKPIWFLITFLPSSTGHQLGPGVTCTGFPFPSAPRAATPLCPGLCSSQVFSQSQGWEVGFQADHKRGRVSSTNTYLAGVENTAWKGVG